MAEYLVRLDAAPARGDDSAASHWAAIIIDDAPAGVPKTGVDTQDHHLSCIGPCTA
jgi:hypothetical protein